MVVTRDYQRSSLAAPSLLREALLLGVIGAAAVAVWFLAVDVARDQLWFTPAALGSALFLGARGIGEVQVSALIIGGYTLVHVTAFILVALLVVMLIRSIDYHPPAILGAVLLLVTMETFMIGLLAIMASWLLDALSLWTVLIANLLAGAAMGLYLWQRYGLQDRLRSDLEERQ